MILILDDNNDRHRLFKAIYGDSDADHAHDVERFIQKLNETRDFVSRVFLDHDLVRGHYSESTHDGECGCAAVKALVEFYNQTGRIKPEIVIHSRNNSAAHLMAKTLEAAGYKVRYLPFE